jgi:hypothetical protein
LEHIYAYIRKYMPFLLERIGAEMLAQAEFEGKDWK